MFNVNSKFYLKQFRESAAWPEPEKIFVYVLSTYAKTALPDLAT